MCLSSASCVMHVSFTKCGFVSVDECVWALTVPYSLLPNPPLAAPSLRAKGSSVGSSHGSHRDREDVESNASSSATDYEQISKKAQMAAIVKRLNARSYYEYTQELVPPALKTEAANRVAEAEAATRVSSVNTAASGSGPEAGSPAPDPEGADSEERRSSEATKQAPSKKELAQSVGENAQTFGSHCTDHVPAHVP